MPRKSPQQMPERDRASGEGADLHLGGRGSIPVRKGYGQEQSGRQEMGLRVPPPPRDTGSKPRERGVLRETQ